MFNIALDIPVSIQEVVATIAAVKDVGHGSQIDVVIDGIC